MLPGPQYPCMHAHFGYYIYIYIYTYIHIYVYINIYIYIYIYRERDIHKLSEHQIGGRRAVSGAGMEGKG